MEKIRPQIKELWSRIVWYLSYVASGEPPHPPERWGLPGLLGESYAIKAVDFGLNLFCDVFPCDIQVFRNVNL